MQHAPLPASPSPEDFRALARSSPWRFRTLHWSSRGVVPQDADGRTEAWLQRPGLLTVRDGDGVHLAQGAPYGGPPAGDPAPPVLRPDGLVAQRPEGYHLTHGDPMWQSYLWTAMLDPEELSHDVALTDVRATERLGRPTWWATAEARPGYEPRCGCCPLLLGLVSVELEHGPFEEGGRGWEPAWDDLPTTYLVGLDVQTGIVVDVTPLDGSGGTRLANEIHAVDTRLDPPAPRSDGSRRPLPRVGPP